MDKDLEQIKDAVEELKLDLKSNIDDLDKAKLVQLLSVKSTELALMIDSMGALELEDFIVNVIYG